MSDDDGIPECGYCYDHRGVCDRFPHLQNDRFFTVKLEETFDVCTYIPCHARPYVLEKLGFGLDDFENVETRKAHLRTKHGYEFLVKFYNAVDRSHFCCSNWEALYKTYGFEEGMRIRFDIRPEDYDDDDNNDIWVDVDMPPVLPRSYFLSSRNSRKVVDSTYYSYDSKLNCEEKGYLVSFIEDVEAFKTSHSISPNYTGYVPLVHKLLDGNFIAKNLRLPKQVVPDMLFTEGDMHMVSLRPTPSEAYHTAYSISSNDGRLKIKEWSKVMNAQTQIIGDKMNVRKPQVGDRFMSILHYGEGPVYLFYGILARREE
ncbi:unnamed protein product [Triticum aestivum]|uniref:Uncharacterized protein n=1 Tax=Triticum aestivum TaxID=4565 RepID=A0A7H4LQ95_WHEAT|nr:unnamed protein product [Triticum aestivum]